MIRLCFLLDWWYDDQKGRGLKPAPPRDLGPVFKWVGDIKPNDPIPPLRGTQMVL